MGLPATVYGLDIVVIVLMFLIVLTLYFVPSIIAKSRDHHQFATILVLNIFLGWTFIGWVVCLAMSLSATDRGGAPVTQVLPPPPSAAFVPAGWYPDPHQTSGMRWWDGTRWTDSTHQQQI